MRLYIVALMAFLATTSIAQNRQALITPTLMNEENRGERVIVDNIDVDRMRAQLKAAVVAEDVRSVGLAQRVTVVLPVGDLTVPFTAVENTTMSAEFKEAAPDIRAYTLEYGGLRGRLTTTPTTVYAYLYDDIGMVSIAPIHDGSGRHQIDYGVIEEDTEHMHSMCGNHDHDVKPLPKMTPELKAAMADVSNGGILRDYRLAVVGTGEFWDANGGSTTQVRASVTNTVNAMNEIFQNDVSFKFTLLTPQLWNNPADDPFTPDQMGGDGRPEQAARAVNDAFSSNRYDVGHVFHTHANNDGWSGGGVALLRSVCRDGSFGGTGIVKAGGWSGSRNNTTVGWIQLASHEFGHMFDCPHTFNGSGSSCDDAISESTAYEIGSGTTIMSYNGICGPGQNIPESGASDSYFHSNSLLRMVNFINTTGDCAVQTPVANTPPEIDADPCGHDGAFIIPRQTPFILSGTGTDAEGDAITYVWEQYDEDGANSTNTQGLLGIQAGTSDRAPLFRSYPPSLSGNVRYFPNRASVFADMIDPFDVLPRRARTLHFQFVARDNNPLGGGIALQEIEVPVSNTGPLTVTAPAANADFTAGESTTVTWTTGGSDDLCAQVDVLLSADNGESFQYVLATGINYSAGSAAVTIPGSAVNTERAKVMIRCSDSECIQFYNVNQGNFSITSNCLANSPRVCPIDPVVGDQGDAVLDLDLNAILGSNSTELLTTLQESDPNYLYPALNTAGDCFEGFSSNYQVFPFGVELSGNYRFPLTNWQVAGVSVHRAADFVFNDPCASIVASSFARVGSSFFVNQSLVADLEACVDYVFVISSQQSGQQGGFEQIDAGPGPVVLAGETDPDYTTTFVAVDAASIIRTVSADADFTTTPSGDYLIYAVNYKAAGAEPPVIVDPSTWVGQSLDAVIAADNCFGLSGNSKPMEIISTCQIVSMDPGAQSACDPETGTYTQEVTLVYELPPSGQMEFSNGQTAPVTGSPQTVTLTDLPSDGNPVTISAFFVESPACQIEAVDIFMAPDNCCPLLLDLPAEINACQDSMITLDAGDDGATYAWTIDGSPAAETGSMLGAPADGLYAVTVTTATGCAKPDQVQVTFFNNPTANLDVPDTTGCEGETIVLTLDTDGTDISWSRDGTDISGDVQVQAMETGLYRADISNVAGCLTVLEQQITFNPTPSVDLGDNQDLCAGDPLTLDAGTSAATYQWSRNNALLPSETDATIEITESGTYSVVADGGAGCTDEDEVSIEFFALPEITVGGDTAICAGTPITLMTNPQNVTDFTFTANGTPLTIPDLANIVIATGGEYVLSVRNEIDCEVVEDLLVVENDLPVVDLEAERIGCEGSTVLLESPTQGAEYRWERNGQVVGSDETITVDQAGTYNLFVKDDFGCEGSDAIVVTFVPGPTLSIDGANDICAGDVVTLTAATTGDNVQWSRDGQDITGATDLALEVTESGVYRATVEASSGCVVEEQVEIVVFTLPTVDATPSVTLCDGENQDITVATTGDIQQYDWTRDGTAISGGETVTLSEAGVYQVVVTDSNGCSNSADITVITSDLPTLTASAMVLDICDGIGEEVSITTDAANIQWSLNGQDIAGATGTTLTLDEAGNYVATATSAEGCVSTVSIDVNARTSPNVDLGPDVTLCPGDDITLDAQAAASSMVSWSTGQTDPTVTLVNPDSDMQSQETVTLTVTNEFDCANSDEVVITYRPVVVAAIDGPMGVCQGGSAELMATGGLTYSWQDPSGTLDVTDGPTVVATPTATSTYVVAVSDDCPGNEDEVMVTLVIFEAADNVSAGSDTSVVIGQSITLDATGGIAYRWADDPSITMGGSTANPTIAPTVATDYTVTITDSNGCTYSDVVSVTINEDPLAAFKEINVLTPNGDGDNDELVFAGLEAFPDNSLRIYNRWGALLFEARGYQTVGPLWDATRNGEPLPADTYFYVLELDGETIKSALTILRD